MLVSWDLNRIVLLLLLLLVFLFYAYRLYCSRVVV